MTTTTTMADVIVPKSDQWNADDFIPGPRTFTIRDVEIRSGEQPVNIFVDGSDKAYRPCKSMCRVLVSAWGKDAKLYVGRSLTLYRDPSVKWAGVEIGGIRISHLSHIEGKLQMQLTATRGARKPFVVLPLSLASHRPHPDLEQLKEQARDQALYGSATLEEHWKRLTREQRVMLKPFLEELKAAAADVDAKHKDDGIPVAPSREPGEDDPEVPY